MWSRGLLAGLAWIVPQSICDVDVLREDGSGLIATVVQDSAVGWDTTIYPHCVFADEPHFAAIDTDSSKTLSPIELNDDGMPAPTEGARAWRNVATATTRLCHSPNLCSRVLTMLVCAGAGSLMSMDQNYDGLVDVLEFASGAHDYLALKGIAVGGEPNPNITCATCASGWIGQHCNEHIVPVEIKIAVRASQAYFDTQKQEALRRALALGLEWNQVRVVVKSVVTTETEGQLMQAELLAGGDGRHSTPKAAAVFLANAGSNWYQATLWESLWYLHVVCPTNCTVRVEGDTRTWRSPLDAKCTGPENQRIYALGQQDCENTRNDNSWFSAEVSRCEDRSAACKDADGNAVSPQPAGIGPCLDVDGQTWEPTILSSGETEAECKTPASGNLYLPGASGVCVDTTAGNVPTQRVKSANIPAADGPTCGGMANTLFQYGVDHCVNTEGEKANMPLGHNSNKYPPFRAVPSPPLSGPGQDATQSLWFSSDSQVECEEIWTTHDYVEPVEGQCFRCKGSDEQVIEPPEETADTDGIIRYKRECEAVTGQTWEVVPGLLTEQTCEWIPRDNEWEEAVEPGCFLGEVQQPQYAVNLTTEKECVTAIHTGTCDGKRGVCDVSTQLTASIHAASS
eukprot:COSAG02_NODE_220_length_28426_cov_28.546863_5_plen_626_part_00